MFEPLPPEKEEGNIEYKRSLIYKDGYKLIKLKSQMLWRIEEGMLKNGIREAIYYLGIDDDGQIAKIKLNEIQDSIKILNSVVNDINAEIISTKIQKKEDYAIAKIVIRKNIQNSKEEIKICLLGPTEHGKSTLISVLTHGFLDNGNGSARTNVIRYIHEFKHGKTSTVTNEILGFKDDTLINYNYNLISSWESVYNNSNRIIELIDLPGSSKYLKTLIFGILAYKPHYALIVLDISKIYNLKDRKIYLNDESITHISICKKLKLPFIIVFTKSDLINEIYFDSIHYEINRILNIIYDTNVNTIILNNNFTLSDSIPIIFISNVTGFNLDIFKKTIKNLPKINNTNSNNELEFMINESLYISDVGTVVIGIVLNGSLKIGSTYLLGPYKNSFYNVKIESIHKKQIPVNILNTNESGSLVIKCNEPININKHMFLINDDLLKNFINEFNIKIIKKEESSYNKLKPYLSLMIFINNIYDRIFIKDIVDYDSYILCYVIFCDDNINYIRNDDVAIIRCNNDLIFGIVSKISSIL